MQNRERKLKILPKFFPRALRTYVMFPEIRLAGKWLQDLGFTAGRFVVISLEDNKITLTVLPEAQVQPMREPKRIEAPIISPEIDALPGDQVFQVWAAEDYYAWLSKRKGKQFIPPEIAEEISQPADDSQLVQLHPEVGQLAAPDDQIIPLHPEVNLAADNPNFHTIA